MEKIKNILSDDFINSDVTIHGWVYRTRSSGKITFIILRDSSGIIQCIASGMMFLEDRRKFFIPVLIFYILDAALLFESRVAIAPVFNTKLPYTTDSIAALILDFIMIIISIAIILMAKTQKK